MERLLADIRHAVRTLARAPGFAVVTVATLALGIGANTAIFSIVNAVILKPLGYPEPGQLMYLTTRFPNMGFDQFWVSPPEFLEFREINQSFQAVGAFSAGVANQMAGERPVRVRTALVTDDLMSALGIPAAQGRLFAPGETDVTGAPAPETRGAPPPQPPRVAILSHELWQSAFGGRPMLGQMVDINGVTREVIGIMPPGADVMDGHTEIWLPLGLNPANRQNRGSHYLYLIGRLRDGVSADVARAELDSLVSTWGERVGATTHVYTPEGHRLQMTPVQTEIIGSASRAIWVLQAAVGFVLLIACANLANLLLARAETRRREFAVRTALGAGRARLLRQFMTEGVILALAGGAAGIVLARVGIRAILDAYPGSLPRTAEVAVDPTVLAFTCAVSVGTGIVFGLAPLLHTSLASLSAALKDGSARGSTGGPRHMVRRGLVMAEVALAVVLVVGAALLLRTVYRLAAVDAGFDRSRLVTFQMMLPPANYQQPAPRAQLYARLLERLRSVPGVQAASAMSGLPPDRRVDANDTEIDNYTAPPDGPFENVDYYQNVMGGYFETMGIPIVQGRAFEPTDATAPAPVAIVNETLVQTFWKDLNPIGQRLRPCCGDQIRGSRWWGSPGDVKQGGVDRRRAPSSTSSSSRWPTSRMASRRPP
ncbi:MAG: ADOP family duplicated permease [Vicinamibacterales bacterium]